jgi:hypothetical protein
MIESVDRLVTTPIRECPPLVEAAIVSDSPMVTTFWVTIEQDGPTDYFVITDVKSGYEDIVPGNAMVTWLKPEDMNCPAIQAEIIAQLAAAGIDLP